MTADTPGLLDINEDWQTVTGTPTELIDLIKAESSSSWRCLDTQNILLIRHLTIEVFPVFCDGLNYQSVQSFLYFKLITL